MRLKLFGVGALFFALGCGCGPIGDDIRWDTGWVDRPDTAWWWDSGTETDKEETGETGEQDLDLDGDGFPQSVDCDDTDADVHPDARDTPEDGVDQDCSGSDSLAWTAMAVGGDTACAIREGDLSCFQQGLLEGDFTDVWVSASGLTVCAAAGSEFSCWGEDLLGLVSQAPEQTPEQVDLGSWHACRLDGTELSCWGSDAHEQRLPEGEYHRMATGSHNVCGTTLDSDELVCAGADFSGQSSPPQGVAVDALDLSGERGCAIIDERSRVSCWGKKATEAPDFELSLVDVAVGEDFTCVLVEDGSLACWGDLEVESEGPWTQVEAGVGHLCALAEDGLMQCWGFPGL